jgi:hypothetical protein
VFEGVFELLRWSALEADLVLQCVFSRERVFLY